MNSNLTPNPELRAKARFALTGKWTPAVLVALVYILIAGAISCIPVVNSLSILVVYPLIFGMIIIFLNLMRSGTEPKIDELFLGFKTYGAVLGTMLLTGIYTFLWMLLLIVPGIIKSYSYAMVPYLLKDEPELSADATIEKSMAMMSGNKMKLFLLNLSFIGWWLLCILTAGIGLLWLMPYMLSANAAFYEDLKNAQQPQSVEA